MGDVSSIFAQYGPWVAVLFALLLNLDKIGKFADGTLQRILPSYEAKAREREHTRQVEIRGIAQAEKERTDTILVFRDMMLEYRKRLDDLEIQSRRERQEHEATMIDMIRGYERSQAQTVEVMRDVSEVIRSQTSRLNHIHTWIKQQEEG